MLTIEFSALNNSFSSTGSIEPQKYPQSSSLDRTRKQCTMVVDRGNASGSTKRSNSDSNWSIANRRKSKFTALC